MEMMLWNLALTVIVAILSFFLKGKFMELDRLGQLLTKTREEIARDHITRAEFRADMEKLREHFDDGFARLEAKLDSLSRLNGNGRNGL